MTGLARNTDPDTAHKAAESVNATRLMGIVLKTLRAHPEGLTTEEICKRSGLDLQSVTPRMKPLESAKLVFRTKIRRKGATGRTRIVWAAMPTQEVLPL